MKLLKIFAIVMLLMLIPETIDAGVRRVRRVLRVHRQRVRVRAAVQPVLQRLQERQ